MGWRISLCAISVVVSACASQGAETTDPPEQATTSSQSTTSAPATTATTVSTETSTTLDDWDTVKVWRGGPAGEYRMAVFEPEFKFTTASSFLPTVECTDMTTIVKSRGDDLSGFWFHRSSQGSVEETLAHYQSQDPLAIGETEAIEVGGAPGVRASVELVDNWISGGCGQSFQTARGSTQTINIVDVAGQTVTFFVDDIPGVSDEDVQTLIDSIEWKDLSGS